MDFDIARGRRSIVRARTEGKEFERKFKFVQWVEGV